MPLACLLGFAVFALLMRKMQCVKCCFTSYHQFTARDEANLELLQISGELTASWEKKKCKN